MSSIHATSQHTWVVLALSTGHRPRIWSTHDVHQALVQFFELSTAIMRALPKTTYQLVGGQSDDVYGPRSLGFFDGDQLMASLQAAKAVDLTEAQVDRRIRFENSLGNGDVERVAKRILFNINLYDEMQMPIPATLEQRVSAEVRSNSPEAQQLSARLAQDIPYEPEDWSNVWDALPFLLDPSLLPR
jgi:hypothetical protein